MSSPGTPGEGAGNRRLIYSLAFVPLWSSGFIAASLGVGYVSPIVVIFWRFAIAVAVLLAISLAFRAPWPRGWRAWRDLVVVGLLLQFLQFVGGYSGLAFGVPAGVTSLVMALAPLLVSVLAVPFLGESLKRIQLLGLGLGLLGVLVVLAGDFSTPQKVWPLLFTLMGMAGLTAGTLYQKKFNLSVDIRTGLTVQAGVGLACSALALLVVPSALLPSRPEGWWPIVFLGLFNSVAAIGLLFLLLGSSSAVWVSTLLNLVPPVTVLLSALILHEPVTWALLAGLVLTLAGAFLANRAERRGRLVASGPPPGAAAGPGSR